MLIFFVPSAVYGQAAGGQQQTVCLDCHDSDIMKPEFKSIPSEWRKSRHFQNDVSCHNCHGGDPKDAAMAMSSERGFVGKPAYSQVPEFCGKCHIGILKNYLESGHGRALKATQSGPNCVTCHGSHGIQKADINIINEQRCSQCHTYERAKTMKQALFLTEKKIRDVEGGLKELKRAGVFTEDQDKTLFSTEAEFRTLFHSVDVALVKDRTDGFIKKLDVIDSQIKDFSRELLFRKNFSAFLMLVFLGIGLVFHMLSKTPE
jgi:formate-dependent nitrite reductase cytochrome c552 subunit